MFDSTRGFFVQNVLANFNDYISSTKKPSAGKKTDMRLGMNAATSRYHMREHMPSEFQKGRKDLTDVCPDYDLLGDIVNCFKHQTLTKSRNPKVSSATSLQECVIVTEYVDNKGPFRIASKEVYVTTVDGQEKPVCEVLINILNMWIHELGSLGIIEMPEYVRTQAPLTRAHADGAANLGLEINAGEDFQQQIRMKRYDYESERIVPIDLTGCEVKGQIYQAVEEIVFTATNNATGEEHQVIVTLTEEQAHIYRSIDNEDAKQKFVNEIINASPIAHDLIR